MFSMAISVLVFRPLMMGKHYFVGLRGDRGDPVTVELLPLNSRIDSRVPAVLGSKVDNLQPVGASNAPFISHNDDLPDVAYLPASMLTQRPIVLVDIHHELPESLQGVDPQFVDLLLLINAFGDVDQVRLESLPALSASMVLWVGLVVVRMRLVRAATFAVKMQYTCSMRWATTQASTCNACCP